MKGQGSALSGDWRREEREGQKNRAGTRSRGVRIVPPGSHLGPPGAQSSAAFIFATAARPTDPAAKPRIRGFHPPNYMPKALVTTPASYEAALEELEQLVGLIESGQLPLEQLLTGYQRGAELLKYCRDKLQAVEHQIKVLDDGVLKPWTQE